MRRIGGVLKNILFWSYERGSWPYDLMVLAIVLFVLFVPRSWFHDQPRRGLASDTAGLELVTETPDGTLIYRIPASSLAVKMRTPELERDISELLRRHVDTLETRRFSLEDVRAIRNADGTVLYYEVTVRP
jgi:hypothetical protein